MSNTYQVNPSPSSGSTTKSFVCAILVFLSICVVCVVLIYLCSPPTEIIIKEKEQIGDGHTNEKLIIVKVIEETTIKSFAEENIYDDDYPIESFETFTTKSFTKSSVLSNDINEAIGTTTETSLSTNPTSIGTTLKEETLTEVPTTTPFEKSTTFIQENLTSFTETPFTTLNIETTQFFVDSTTQETSTEPTTLPSTPQILSEVSFTDPISTTTENILSSSLSTTKFWTQIITSSSSTNSPTTTQKNNNFIPLKKSSRKFPKQCTSPNCFKTASQILSKMNHNSSAPCEDFYEFSCGNFVSKKKKPYFIEFSNLEMPSIEEPQRIFFQFYNACLAHEQLSFLDRLKLFANYAKKDVSTLTLLQTMPFINWGMDISENQYVQRISFEEQTLHQTLKDWSVTRKIRKICSKKLVLKPNLNQVYQDFQKCVETAFQGNLNQFVSQMQAFEKHNLLNLTGVFDFFNLFSAKQYIIQIFAKNILENTFEKANFNVSSEQFFNINLYDKEKLQNFNRETAKLFHLWSVFEDFVNNEDQNCEDRAIQLMPDTLNYFLRESLPIKVTAEDHLRLYLTFTVLQKQLIKSLKSSNFTDPSNKTIFFEKLNSLNLTSIKDVIFEPSTLQEQYLDLNLTKNHLENTFLILDQKLSNLQNLNGKIVTKENLYINFIDPFSEEPISFPGSNLIVVPPGVFKKNPPELPDYIQNGQFAFQLAKEIALQLDPITLQPDNFESLVSDTLDLMGEGGPVNFQGQNLNFQINKRSGKSLVAENTALRLMEDISDLSRNPEELPWISSSYNHKQLFFLAIAQEYCEEANPLDFVKKLFESNQPPSTLSVRNLMSNSNGFSSSFECIKGHGLNTNPFSKFQFPYIDNTEYNVN